MTDKVFIKGQRVKITNPQTGVITSGTATGKQAKNGYWEIHNHDWGFVFWFPASELEPDEPEPTEPEQPAAARPEPEQPDITVEFDGGDIVTITSRVQQDHDSSAGILFVGTHELPDLIADLQNVQGWLDAGASDERKKILDDYCALHD